MQGRLVVLRGVEAQQRERKREGQPRLTWHLQIQGEGARRVGAAGRGWASRVGFERAPGAAGRGGLRTELRTSTLAPAVTRARQIVSCPCSAALCRAVILSCVDKPRYSVRRAGQRHRLARRQALSTAWAEES